MSVFRFTTALKRDIILYHQSDRPLDGPDIGPRTSLEDETMSFYRWAFVSTAIITLLIATASCSGSGSASGSSPLSPPLTSSEVGDRAGETAPNHALLGLYTCRVDPLAQKLEMVPLREAMFHLNALRFVEPPPPLRILLSNLVIESGKVDVDVQFVHPFPGLDQYTGFDVCGIVITSGSISGFSDPDLVVAGEGDTRLTNPDGLSRWWNPREFPYNEDVKMWGYINGVKGLPDEIGHFTATLNGYKYHADGLSVYDDLTALDPQMRGAFSAGAGHTRHYTIELDAGMVFNYAIDACWFPPEGQPIEVPDSFSPSANREEPYLILTDVTDNTLWYDPSTGSGGGELGLDVHCYDWFDAWKLTVRVESPGVFNPVADGVPTGGGDVFSTYHVDISDPMLTSNEPVTVWVSAEADWDYQGLLPGKLTAAYMVPFEVDVATSAQGNDIVLKWRPEGVIEHGSRIPFNDIDPALIINGAGDLLLSFFWWGQDAPDHWYNCPRFSTSTDHGHSFGWATFGQWQWHGVSPTKVLCWNGKFTLGSNGQAFHSYGAPCGHTLHPMPTFEPYTEAASHSGTVMEHAGEMLYTVEGYPMMFGDQGGTITMQRGDYPNQGGTGTWPVYEGTQYVLVAEGMPNWLSLSRSTGKTSDGLCRLIFWHPGLPYIRMVSTTDISGQNWDEPRDVFVGLAEIWVGAKDPSLWIDENDGFHTCFAGEIWWGEYQLVYGYSPDGQDWDEATSFEYLNTVPVEDGMNDTQVVVFDAFDDTYIFISYESAEDVWCVYKKSQEKEFSEPIKVNEHAPARLPDIYPNGDVGAVFAYEADDGTGTGLTDIFYRLAEFVEE